MCVCLKPSVNCLSKSDAREKKPRPLTPAEIRANCFLICFAPFRSPSLHKHVWKDNVSKMAASPAGNAMDAQARFGHSVKGLLTEKVTSCGTDVIALTKQVLRGSRSAEVSETTKSIEHRAGEEL